MKWYALFAVLLCARPAHALTTGSASFNVSGSSIVIASGLNGAAVAVRETSIVTVTPGTGTWSVQFTSGSASNPFYTVSTNTFVNDRSGTGTINALNGLVAVNTQGASTIMFTLTGAWTATVSIQGFDGTSWITAGGVVPLSGLASFLTFDQSIAIPCGGFQQVRMIATAYTSGTIGVNYDVGAGNNTMQVYNNQSANLLAQVNQSGAWTVTPGTGTWTTSGSSVTSYQGGVWTVQAGTATAQMASGVYNAITPNLASGTTNVLQLDSGGRLLVNSAVTPVSNYFSFDSGQINAPSALAQNPMLMFINLSTNTKSMLLTQRIYSSIETTGYSRYQLILDPVFTSSGTNLTGSIQAVNQTSPGKSQMAVYSIPTVTSSTMSVEGFVAQFPYQTLVIQDNQSISLSPGHKLLVTSYPGTVNKTSYFTFKWLEQ